MTKEELLTLAERGEVDIAQSRPITQYAVTPRIPKNATDEAYPAIFMRINDQTGEIDEDHTYFTDGDVEEDLTFEETETLRDAIDEAMSKH